MENGVGYRGGNFPLNFPLSTGTTAWSNDAKNEEVPQKQEKLNHCVGEGGGFVDLKNHDIEVEYLSVISAVEECRPLPYDAIKKILDSDGIENEIKISEIINPLLGKLTEYEMKRLDESFFPESFFEYVGGIINKEIAIEAEKSNDHEMAATKELMNQLPKAGSKSTDAEEEILRSFHARVNLTIYKFKNRELIELFMPRAQCDVIGPMVHEICLMQPCALVLAWLCELVGKEKLCNFKFGSKCYLDKICENSNAKPEVFKSACMAILTESLTSGKRESLNSLGEQLERVLQIALSKTDLPEMDLRRWNKPELSAVFNNLARYWAQCADLHSEDLKDIFYNLLKNNPGMNEGKKGIILSAWDLFVENKIPPIDEETKQNYAKNLQDACGGYNNRTPNAMAEFQTVEEKMGTM